MYAPVIYGEVKPNGEVIAPTHCAISGAPLVSGDLITRIKGTPYNFGIKAELKPLLTAEKRQEIIGNAPKIITESPAPARAPRQVQVKEADNG